MSDYSEFFLNSSSEIIQFETFEISHPNFSKVYRIVRNSADGLTATLETAATVTFEYYPVRITPSETSDNLDYSIEVEFGDVGEVLPIELERVAVANNFLVKPVFKYRVFRSDDLAQPLFGPLVLEIQSFAMDKNGCVFEAKAPNASLNATGLRYGIDKFPSLRFFL